MQTTHQQPHDQAQAPTAGEWYERGLALRKAGLFNKAIEQFQKAGENPAYQLKSYAQIALGYKSANRYEDAVNAFRIALASSPTTSKETVQILYVMGRTLESLGRISETLEAYRWIRREDANYRDVASRIENLSSRRATAASRKPSTPEGSSWVNNVLKNWHGLLKNSE